MTNNNNDGTWTWLDLHISSFFCNKTMCRTSDATIIRVALICVYLILRSACKPLKTALETKCDNEARRKRQKGRKSAHFVYIHSVCLLFIPVRPGDNAFLEYIYICVMCIQGIMHTFETKWNEINTNYSYLSRVE